MKRRPEKDKEDEKPSKRAKKEEEEEKVVEEEREFLRNGRIPSFLQRGNNPVTSEEMLPSSSRPSRAERANRREEARRRRDERIRNNEPRIRRLPIGRNEGDDSLAGRDEAPAPGARRTLNNNDDYQEFMARTFPGPRFRDNEFGFVFPPSPVVDRLPNNGGAIDQILRGLGGGNREPRPQSLLDHMLGPDHDDHPHGIVISMPSSQFFGDPFAHLARALMGQQERERPPLPESKLPDKIEDEPNAKNGEELCIICEQRAVKTTLVPCGHQYMCVTCCHSPAMKDDCAICRKRITNIVRFFPAAANVKTADS